MQINTNLSQQAPAKPRWPEQRAQQMQASAKPRWQEQPERNDRTHNKSADNTQRAKQTEQ